MVVGAIVGTFLLPGVGTAAGAALGGSIGGVGDAAHSSHQANKAADAAHAAELQVNFDYAQSLKNLDIANAEIAAKFQEELKMYLPLIITAAILIVIMIILIS